MPGLYRRPPQPTQRVRSLIAIESQPVVPAYVQEVMADSPTGYWRLNDQSGTTAVAYTGSNGTYNGSPTLAATGPMARDATDDAATMNGSSRVTVPVNTLNAPYSIEFWVKGAASPTGGDYARLFSAGGDQLEIVHNTSGVVRFLSGGSWIDFDTLSAGEVAHFVYTYDGTNVVIYKNGVETYNAVGGRNLDQTNKHFGSTGTATEGVSDTLDELAIYGSALSSTRVQAHYDAASGGAVLGAASLSATATLAAAAGLSILGSSSLSALATLSAVGGNVLYGAASLDGTASLAAIASLTLGGQASLSADATLGPTPTLILGGVAALDAAATLAAAGYLTIGAAASLSASAELSAVGALSGGVVTAAASLTALATLAAIPSLTVGAIAQLSASADLTAIPGVIRGGIASVSASADLAAAAGLILGAILAATASANLAAVPSMTIGAAASLSASAALSPAASMTLAGAAGLSANATLTAVGFLPNEPASGPPPVGTILLLKIGR